MTEQSVHQNRKLSQTTTYFVGLLVLCAAVSTVRSQDPPARKKKPGALARPTFRGILDESYFREAFLNWVPTPTGVRAVTDEGFILQFNFFPDRAVLTAEGVIERTPEGLIHKKRLSDFTTSVSPQFKPSRDFVGAAGVAECIVIRDVDDEVDFQFSEKAKEMSPRVSATKRGALVEATATLHYEDAAKTINYRMEVKLLNPAMGESKQVAAATPSPGHLKLLSILETAYFRDPSNTWIPTATGMRATTREGFKLDFKIDSDRATLVAEGRIVRTKDGSIDEKRLMSFSAAVSPDVKAMDDRNGAMEVAEAKILEEADREASLDFVASATEKSPTTSASAQGKVIEAKTNLTYDETTKMVKYNMEIKLIDAAKRRSKVAGAAASPPTLNDVLRESYFREPSVLWKSVASGKRATTEEGYKIEFTIETDRAVLVAEGEVKRNRGGAIDDDRFIDFCSAISPESKPKPDRIGAAGVAECKVLREAHDEADSEFSEKAKDRSPKTKATKRGKTFEATVSFSYDDASQTVKYRMEIKKINR